MSREDSQFKAGNEGRKPGIQNVFSMSKFKEAFKADAEKHDSNIFEFFFEKAREEGGAVLVALMRKVLPDMKQVEVTMPYVGGYADKTPAEICKDMTSKTIGTKPDVQ